MMGSLLDDGGLTTGLHESDEQVFECLLRWMRSGIKDKGRYEGLLRKIRFPFMNALYLADEARRALIDHELDGLILESCMLRSLPRHLWSGRELRYLDARALIPRGRVRWDQDNEPTAGRLTLVADGQVLSVARMVIICAGGSTMAAFEYGSGRRWSRSGR